MKYTKLVRCEMTNLQLLTYNDYVKDHEDKLKKEDYSLVNMVFPNPENKKIGLFKKSDIELLNNSSGTFLSTHGIKFYKNQNGELQITGPILKQENLIKDENL